MKKVALVVGVEEYRDKSISRLQFARADARALAECLTSRCRFDVVRTLAEPGGPDEPSQENVLLALENLAGLA